MRDEGMASMEAPATDRETTPREAHENTLGEFEKRLSILEGDLNTCLDILIGSGKPVNTKGDPTLTTKLGGMWSTFNSKSDSISGRLSECENLTRSLKGQLE